jgi:hypothetical protein
MSGNTRDDGIIEIHCTKENPWDQIPFDITKILILHDDAQELYPEYDGPLPIYKCPNCGHEFQVDVD